MGIIYVVQEEREIKEKRDKERDGQRERETGSDAIHTKLHHRLRGAEAREIRAQLIKRLN